MTGSADDVRGEEEDETEDKRMCYLTCLSPLRERTLRNVTFGESTVLIGRRRDQRPPKGRER